VLTPVLHVTTCTAIKMIDCRCRTVVSTVEMKQLLICVCVAKARRQVKAVKPKKMIRVEGKTVVTSACNAGSSAVVSADGEVLLFGKDTFHCDNTTGMSVSLSLSLCLSVCLCVCVCLLRLCPSCP